MLLLGIIAIFQITLFPGLIIVQFLEIRGCALKWTLAFAFSLVLNFELVFLLTLTGFYTRGVMTAVLAIELLALGWFSAKGLIRAQGIKLALSLPWISRRSLVLRFFHSLFVILALYSFAVLLIKLSKENPGVFQQWDDVVSWNRWALEWVRNRLPSQTWEYPQLLPANWSITYLLINSDHVQMFAKAVMAFFPAAVLFIFFDAYQRFSSLGALAAITLCTYFFFQMIGPFIGSGYADIPVAFFATLTFYLIYLYHRDILGSKAALLSVALAASGAALTKQAGLFVLIVALPVLALSVRMKNGKRDFVKGRGFTRVYPMILAVSLLIIPWFGLKQIEIMTGHDQSGVRAVTFSIHAEKNPAKRAWAATANLNKKTGVPRIFLAGFLLLLLFSLRTLVGRMSLLLVALPYYLVWAAFFSYDVRNLALSLPFFSLAAGEGLCLVLGLNSLGGSEERVFSRYLTADFPLAAFLPFSLLILVLGFFGLSACPSERLIEKNIEMQKKVGDPTVNDKLYEFQRSYGFKGKVLSSYIGMAVLPGIRQFFYTGGFKSERDTTAIEVDHDLCETLGWMTSNDEIRYILVYDGVYPAVIARALEEGALSPIFRASGLSFYEVTCPEHLDVTSGLSGKSGSFEPR